MKTRRRLTLKAIRKSRRPEKKWDAVFVKPDGREITSSFGARGMSDFTKHKDVTRRARYLRRHRGMGENWNDPTTPGALSKWLLWGETTSLRKNTSIFKKRFNL